MGRKILLGVVGVGATVALAGVVLAQARVNAPAPASDLWLERRISERQVIEQYVAQAMAPFRQADTDENGLDEADLSNQRRRREAQERAQNVSEVLRYDLNKDLTVTADELATFVGPAAGYRGNELERFDVDGDGRVTLNEALEASDRIGKVNQANARSEYDGLMKLPEARDGRLTAAELEAAARRVFARADRDGNGRISREEAKVFEASLPPEPRRELVRDVYCAMPAVKPSDLIVLYGAYEGVPQRPIGTATIRIEPGKQPIYLVLPSYEAIRWQFSGATDRVRQVVVSSNEQGEGPTSPGADGVPKDRVKVFHAEGCIGYFYQPEAPEAPEAAAAKSAIALRLGRQPDVMMGAYTAKEVALPSGARPGKPSA